MPAISLDNLSRFKGKLVQLITNEYGVTVAQLVDGTVPDAQLPASVYNVSEYASFDTFPDIGASNVIYIDKAENSLYRWDATAQEYQSITSQDSVKFVEQTLTEEQQQQARDNISALGKDEVPENVVTYSPQQLEPEEKIQARTNIGAASSTEVEGLSGTVADLNNRLNNFGDFVRSVEETEGGLNITYDSSLAPEKVKTGLVFDGGYVDDNNYLYLKNGETILPREVFEPVKLPEGGGGGSAITLTDVKKTSVVRNGESAPFSFVATTSDASNLTVRWFVNDVLRDTQIKDSGSKFEFDAQDYLTPSDTSSVKAYIESGSGSTINPGWTVTSNAFAVAWGGSIESIMLYTTNDNIYVPINAYAQAKTNNIVTITVGDNAPITRTVTGSQAITVELNKNLFTSGKNVVSAYMTAADNPEDKTDTIHFTVIWGYEATSPVVAFADDELTCNQYDTVNINYFVFDPENEQVTCTIQAEGGQPVSLTANRTIQTYQYPADVTFGPDETEIDVDITLTYQSASTTMTLTIKKVDYNLNYWRDDSLLYDLNPVGHSNADADREQFGDLVFYNFDWDNGGFKDDASGSRAFVIKKGSRVTLPRALFEDSDVNGKTIDISFMNTNCDQYDAIAMQELDGSSAKGILLRANNGEVRLNSTAGQEFRYSEESRVDMSIHVEAYNRDDPQRIITVWMDGIPSRVKGYDVNTLVQSDNRLVIGSDHCDVWIYGIRIYNSALTKQNMMQNYVSCGTTTKDKIARYKTNMILDSKDRLTPEALLSVAPNLTIVHIYTPRMTVSKEDPVPARITIQDGGTILELNAATSPDSGDGTVFKVQGTSSAAYGRSSYNLDLDFKGTKKKYKISEDAIPVNYINIKVNVASSENANNINAVDWYNTYQPYITEARKTTAGVRDTVEGKPCAVFITNTDTNPDGVWFSSQLVKPNATILYAMGDLCNSKKNKVVFGQDGSGEHPTKGCIEVSGNDTEPERFRSTEAEYHPDADDGKGRWETQGPWDEEKQKYTMIKHFEWRMEPSGSYSDETSDKYEVVTAWDNVVAWLVSTIDDSQKFKREVGQYFAINSMLYHFLFIEYFAAYDNVSKNTFYSYDWDEDAGKYLWNIKCAYDMDTILACDNDGIPYGDYGLDYGDTDGSRSYFNAVTNTIWVNLKKEFQNELSSMYVALRSKGAWNALNIISKWDNYQNKRPRVAMMLDAYTKYVLPYKTKDVVLDEQTYGYDESYLPRMQGSKTYWRKQFLTYQTSYMDGKYGSASKSAAIAFRTNCEEGSARNYKIKSYAKTYMTVIVDDNKIGSQKVNPGEETVFTGVSVGTNTTLYVTPDKLVQYVRPLDDTQNSTFVASGASKLIEAKLGGEEVNTSWPSTSGVTIPSVVLKDISIRNMPNFASALNLSSNVELQTIDARNTSAGAITLPSSAPITSVQLNACTGIEAHNLTKVEQFTMESGENLSSVLVENCNSVFNIALATYLKQATEVTVESTRRVRAVNIGRSLINGSYRYDWNFANLNVLYKIVKSWKGYNALGEEQDKPIVTGYVHIASLSKKKLEAIHAMWGAGDLDDSLDEENKIYTSPSLIIVYDAMIDYYPVSFMNADGTTIKDKKTQQDYVQYVDEGDEAYDPIEEGEVDTPTMIDPAGQYRYTFTGWINLPGEVHEPKTVTADYSSSVITYTIRWFAKEGEPPIYQIDNIEYGKEAVFDPEQAEPKGYPTNTEMEAANTYNLFSGWDKSTGYIKGNIDVYPVWIQGKVPAVGAMNLKDMNIAQIYGIAAKNTSPSYTNQYFSDQDYTDIQVGRDYTFSNVESEVLMTERYFDGNEIYKLENVRLFDENAGSFTLAIDYEFTSIDTNATLIACSDNINGNTEGFRIYSNPSDQSINVRWGENVDTIAHGKNRGIVVLRHRKGSNNLYVASDNGGRMYSVLNWSGYGLDEMPSGTYEERRYGAYNDEKHGVEIPRVQATQTNGCLTFGAIPIGSQGMSSPASGWIHWCKIWYEDLGVSTIKELACWPHETWRMHYRGSKIYNRSDGTGLYDAASFIANAPLSQVYEMYPSTQSDTTGGWRDSKMRAFINSRCLEALPLPWQLTIKSMSIVTKGGADNYTRDESTFDKLYVPSVADIKNVPDTSPLIKAEGKQISWFTEAKYRIKFLGITIPNDVEPITDTATDPTLYTETYTIKEGDVWYPPNQSSNSMKAYVYISAETAAKHGYMGGRDMNNTTNNIVAAGAQGGMWIRTYSYWLRTPNAGTSDSSKKQHYAIYPSGIDSSNVYIDKDNYSLQDRGIVLMFSI